MFSITLICVGKLKEPFYLAAAEEYAKRLRAFADFKLVELPESRLPENPSPAEIAQGLSREAAAIQEHVPKGAWLCVFTPEGRERSSEELAGRLAAVKGSGKSAAAFVIGSSFGIDPSVKQAADERLSVSRKTFPHHLFRVMALEQLYRAESIQAGTKYHK